MRTKTIICSVWNFLRVNTYATRKFPDASPRHLIAGNDLNNDTEKSGTAFPMWEFEIILCELWEKNYVRNYFSPRLYNLWYVGRLYEASQIMNLCFQVDRIQSKSFEKQVHLRNWMVYFSEFKTEKLQTICPFPPIPASTLGGSDRDRPTHTAIKYVEFFGHTRNRTWVLAFTLAAKHPQQAALDLG